MVLFIRKSSTDLMKKEYECMTSVLKAKYTFFPFPFDRCTDMSKLVWRKKTTLSSKTNMRRKCHKMISLAPIVIKRLTKLNLTSIFLEYFGVVVQHLFEIENVDKSHCNFTNNFRMCTFWILSCPLNHLQTHLWMWIERKHSWR